jgi:bifunctional DNA-binding transcriptional regulator/antitoxin component of YhaV-PrlF toxin-antitoxin module
LGEVISNAVLQADRNIRTPAALRKAVGDEPGQKFDVIAKGTTIVLVPAVDGRSLRGSASGAKTLAGRQRRGRAA